MCEVDHTFKHCEGKEVINRPIRRQQVRLYCSFSVSVSKPATLVTGIAPVQSPLGDDLSAYGVGRLEL